MDFGGTPLDSVAFEDALEWVLLYALKRLFIEKMFDGLLLVVFVDIVGFSWFVMLCSVDW